MISFVFEIPEMLRSSFKFYGFKEGSEEVAQSPRIEVHALGQNDCFVYGSVANIGSFICFRYRLSRIPRFGT